MAKKESRNLNVTIKNDDDKNDTVVSIGGILRNLRKYFLPWIVISVMLAALVSGFYAVKVVKSKPPLQALVSFNYSGIEKGLDPAGRTFDVNMVKNSQVIAAALSANSIDMEKASAIQQNITFEGVIPGDAIDKITTYQSVYQNSTTGNLAAAQAMLDVTFYPTQYKVYFDYAPSGLSASDAVKVFNDILDGFTDYFYQQYGYNKTLGTAVSAIEYKDYDYPEAVDLFRSSLSTLSKYVKGLAANDKNQFRANSTGHTFNDLSQAINTIADIDLDKISSYVTVNNITNDKESAIAYYQFRIDSLNRNKDALTEKLNNITETITSYQKDNILVMSGVDGTNAELSKNSEEYDKLIERKDSIASDLAETKQQIKYCQQRKEGLEKSTASTNSMKEKVDKDLAKLNDKLEALIADVEATATEYYEVVEFAHAYNVLVPASDSRGDVVKHIVNRAKLPLIVCEGLLFLIYFGVAFVNSIKEESAKKARAGAKKSRAADDEDDEDEEEADLADVIEAIADEADDEEEEEKKPSPKSSGKNKNKKK